jgi:hypothetical protein
VKWWQNLGMKSHWFIDFFPASLHSISLNSSAIVGIWFECIPQSLICWNLGPQCSNIEVVEPLRGEAQCKVMRSRGNELMLVSQSELTLKTPDCYKGKPPHTLTCLLHRALSAILSHCDTTRRALARMQTPCYLNSPTTRIINQKNLFICKLCASNILL